MDGVRFSSANGHIFMDKRAVIEKAEMLKAEIDKLLRNKLVYPKTIFGLLRKREVSEDKLFKMQDGIDDCIKTVSVRFVDFIKEIEGEMDK